MVDERRTATYAELAADAARLADALARRGVGAGDVVSVQLPNRYETVVVAVAVLSLGAVVNPLLPNYRERELAHVFETARPVAVFTPGEFRGCDHRALVAQVVAATGIAPAARGGRRRRPAAPAVTYADLARLGRRRRGPRRPPGRLPCPS